MTAIPYTEVDLTVYTSADFVQAFQFVDAFENPIDFTGDTFEMDVETAVGQTPSLALSSPSTGIAATDLANGTITITIADTDLSVGSYVYDLIRVSGSTRELLMYGTITVLEGKTTA